MLHFLSSIKWEVFIQFCYFCHWTYISLTLIDCAIFSLNGFLLGYLCFYTWNMVKWVNDTHTLLLEYDRFFNLQPHLLRYMVFLIDSKIALLSVVRILFTELKLHISFTSYRFWNESTFSAKLHYSRGN